MWDVKFSHYDIIYEMFVSSFTLTMWDVKEFIYTYSIKQHNKVLP